MQGAEGGPPQWLEGAAHGSPDRAACLLDDNVLSFSELYMRLGQTTRGLRAAGLRTGEVLSVISPRNHHLALGAYLSLYAGTPYLPVNPHRGSLPDVLDQGAVGQGLSVPEYWSRVPALRLKLPTTWLERAVGTEIAPPAALPATGIQLIVGTSGSSGSPRWTMLTNRNLAAAVSASRRLIPVGPGDIWLAPLPLHHVGGLMILLRCLQARATALIQDRFSPEDTWEQLRRHRVTHVSLVPAMLAGLLDGSGGARAPDSLRVALVGGGPLPGSLARRALRAGWPLYASYGMTEAGSQVATQALSADWEPRDLGPPLPGFEVEIRHQSDEAGRGVGRIHISGAAVMAGYLQRGGRHGSGLEPDGGFTTGDLGYLDGDGHLHILGRVDAVIVTGGENVHPLVVEQRIRDCPGVEDIAILGQTDEVWGQRVVALVVGEIRPAQLGAWCRDHLPSPWRPRRILKVDRLPRNALGKLRRDELTALSSQATQGRLNRSVST